MAENDCDRIKIILFGSIPQNTDTDCVCGGALELDAFFQTTFIEHLPVKLAHNNHNTIDIT